MMPKPEITTLETVSNCSTRDEVAHISELAAYLKTSHYDPAAAAAKATIYIEHVRREVEHSGIETFFQEYGFGSAEGMAIMRLAESLLRIPDAASSNDLLHDALQGTQWQVHMGRDKSMLINSSAAGLQLAQRLFSIGGLVQRIADPVVRSTVKQVIGRMGEHFVLEESPKKAIEKSQWYQQKGYEFSYDQLGEGARSEAEATRYAQSYLSLLQTLPKEQKGAISIKLSALCPRLEWLKRDEVVRTLIPRIRPLIEQAKSSNISITFDAEETMRHDLMLWLFEQLISDPVARGYQGLGIAVQAYHKQAFETIGWLIHLAELHQKQIPVRLVKGAYWDMEIKQAQLEGLINYPVFTQKAYTDISYMACAAKMLEYPQHIMPQFATHNAYTIAVIEQLGKGKVFEFQKLFGMADGLYDYVVGHHPCRIYAPIGRHAELLPYLIRRLIENGANNAFIREIADNTVPIGHLVTDPLCVLEPQGVRLLSKEMPLPRDITPGRMFASGIAFGNRMQVAALEQAVAAHAGSTYEKYSMIEGKPYHGTIEDIQYIDLVKQASQGAESWGKMPVAHRVAIAHRAARQLETHHSQLIHLLISEAGKTIKDAVSEVREAIDYCRYYAQQAERLMSDQGIILPSPTGETNRLTLHPKGVFVCISPWNFPLAIFLGQIMAALMAGNSVIAKPAELTPRIATYAVRLMHEAGVPPSALHLILIPGREVSEQILSQKEIAGVAFTGSTATAQSIHQALAKKPGKLATLIAETGGLNAMVVDSTALVQQAVDDIIVSAFGSAGQRCSSCRIVCVQEDIADKLIEVLAGAMQTLKVGDPAGWDIDIGPVISPEAYKELSDYIERMKSTHRLLAATLLERKGEKGAGYKDGYFIAPHVFEIASVSDLTREVFGPILHLVRYRYDQLDQIIEQINVSGYGLTLGIHSRIEQTCDYIRKRVHVGNVYVNRSMIGAVVGMQPFGGEGLSGTGFKAGGPHYLLKFVNERTYTVNTVAIGGNRELLNISGSM